MLLYLLFPAVMGLYALIAGLAFHWLVAYVLAGMFFGCANAFLSLSWSHSSKWFHYTPYALVFASGLGAIHAYRYQHTKLLHACLTFVLATGVFYVYLLLKDRWQKRLEQRREFLEAELFIGLTTMEPGEARQLTVDRLDGGLLGNAFYYLKNRGWRVDRYPATSFLQPHLRLFYFYVVAPESPEVLKASLDQFHTRYDDE
jgi:hypothetical protein